MSGSILKSLEKAGDIIVERIPEHKKNGQPTNFWFEDKNHSLRLKLRI
jgi:hypothetical protein